MGRKNSESGLALILSLFLVAIATIIVTSSTSSSTVESRLTKMTSQSLQAEYLMKSALELTRVMLANDGEDSSDSYKDIWGPFIDGQEIPIESLGLELPGVRLVLEIRPYNSRLNLNSVIHNEFWRDALVTLFSDHLGFDEDGETNHLLVPSPESVFSSEDLVANLIDYLDADSDSYQLRGQGVESSLEADYFPNDGRIGSIEELALIPGFTPARRAKLFPYVHAQGNFKVNPNIAPLPVLASLHPTIDLSVADAIRSEVDSEEGPLKFSDYQERLERIIPSFQYGSFEPRQSLSNVFEPVSFRFAVLVKVSAGQTRYFMEAEVYVQRSGGSLGELPRVVSVSMYL